MNKPFGIDAGCALRLEGEAAVARPSGALWLPERGLLVVADLHLGKSERLARRGGALLPPYETRETLARLAAEIDALRPETALCLGDSFDDADAAEALDEEARETLARLAAGRRWVWAVGNHDPGPIGAPGAHVESWRECGIVFRHIADPALPPGLCEVSGHYHPKALLPTRGRGVRRRCFLVDARRVILPAFGAYTGGLDATNAAFDRLLAPDARALLLGARVAAAPRAALAACV